MKPKLCFLIFAIFLLANSHNLHSESGRFSVSQPAMEVNAIAQDERGYIWIATSAGLASFNGSGYMVWEASNAEGGLFNDDIRSLCIDSDGRLWIGSECGVTYRDGNDFVNMSEAVYDPVSAIKELDADHLLVLCKDGLVKYEKNTLAAVAAYSSVGTSWLKHVEIASSGDIWFATTSGGGAYIHILDASLNEKRTVALGRVPAVSGICEAADGDIYVAAGDRVRRFDPETCDELPVDALNAVCSGASAIHFMLPYKENEILIGLRGKGFFAYCPETEKVRHIIRSQPLKDEKYLCFVDRDYRIWVSDGRSPIKAYNPKGIYTHYAPRGEEYTKNFGHPYFDREGLLWMCVDDRICCMDPDSGRLLYEGRERGCSNLLIDSKGRLWTIFRDNEVHLWSVRGGSASLVRSYATPDGVFSLSEDAEGRILLSSVNSIFSIGEDFVLRRERVEGDMPFTMLLSDRVTRRVFMFTSSSGLFELMPDMTAVKVETGDVKGISYVTPAHDGSLWIGTYNEGVLRYGPEEGRLEHYGRESGLSELSIKAMIEDDYGNIWFSTPSNIVMFDVKAGVFNTLHDDWFSEGRSYGLVSVAKSPGGDVFFGGSGGVTKVNPSLPFPKAENVRIDFEQILVNGKPVEYSDSGLSVQHDNSLITIRFSGLDYDSGPYLYYSYIMEGYDTNPINVYGEGVAVYNHLPAGRYVFKVKVKHADGHWSENELCLPVNVSREPGSFGAGFLMLMLSGCAALAVAVVVLYRKAYPRAAGNVAEAGRPDNDSQESFWGGRHLKAAPQEDGSGVPVKRKPVPDESPEPSAEAVPGESGSVPEAAEAETVSPLIGKMESIIQANLDNDGFTVNDLAISMGMSYSSLYAKVKSLTGITPQQFVMSYRMERAREFLLSGEYSVSEVSYKVGSSSPMTFSREFKKHFGCPPSSLLKK